MQHELVVSDPASVARWESSEGNAFRSKLEVVQLRTFRDKMTERGHPDAKPAAVELCGALASGAATEQAEALKRFVENEVELYSKVRAAIYLEYRKSYSTYKQAWLAGNALFGGDAKEIQNIVPEIVKGNELDGLISFGTIYIARPEKGVSRIVVSLRCPWDEEHGMGAVIAGGDVEKVSDAGTVMLAVVPRPTGLTGLKDGNVAIYLANMAFQPRIIDIRLQIDGAPIVEGNFEHDLQRPYARYLVSLSPGEHRLKVDSRSGQAALEEVFTVKDQAHIAVSYYHSEAGLLDRATKPVFTFHFDDQPWIPERGWRPGN